MKKSIISLFSIFLIIAGVFLSFSTNEKQEIKLIENADAESVIYINFRQRLSALCPDGVTVISVCGEGFGACFSLDECP